MRGWQSDHKRHSIASYGAFATQNNYNEYVKHVREINDNVNSMRTILKKAYEVWNDESVSVQFYDNFFKRTSSEYNNNRENIINEMHKIIELYFSDFPELYSLITMSNEQLWDNILDIYKHLRDNLRYDYELMIQKLKTDQITKNIIMVLIWMILMKKHYPEYIVVCHNGKFKFETPECEVMPYGKSKSTIKINEIYCWYSLSVKCRLINDKYKFNNRCGVISTLYHILKASRPNTSQKELIKLTYDFIEKINSTSPYQYKGNKVPCLVFNEDEVRKFGIEKLCITRNHEIIKFADEKTIERLKKDSVFTFRDNL